MRVLMVAALMAALPVMASAPIAAAQAKGDVPHGEATFEDRCESCHAKNGGGQGPTLVGVVGRKSAAVPGVLYSKALQNAHLTWTPAELDKFLTDPAVRVPGTAMPLAVPSAKDRADLIAYLGSPANKR